MADAQATLKALVLVVHPIGSPTITTSASVEQKKRCLPRRASNVALGEQPPFPDHRPFAAFQ
jgi:hypothetical protein